MKEDILMSFIHELVNNYMPILNKSASLLSKSTESKKYDIPTIEHNARNILETLELLNTNLKILNIELNPAFFEFQQKQPINIHGAFLRCTKLLKYRAKEKNIKFEFDTFEEKYINEVSSIPIVTGIPYILLDNCIKFSPSSSTVEIGFSKLKNELNVTVSSMGPEVGENEVPKLTERGYRGNKASESSDGTGIGLYYFDQICKFGDVKYNINCGKSKFSMNGINYSSFQVELLFKLD